jgi:hypothetical protein
LQLKEFADFFGAICPFLLATTGFDDGTAKSRHPLKKRGFIPFNLLKKIDFHLRGNDVQVLWRLFAMAS